MKWRPAGSEKRESEKKDADRVGGVRVDKGGGGGVVVVARCLRGGRGRIGERGYSAGKRWEERVKDWDVAAYAGN